MISSNKKVIAGIDEVGRGCIAGPVVAAAVILSEKRISDLKDSKKLAPKKRLLVAQEIKQKAICWSIGIAWPKEIDRYNIFNATTLAMLRALRSLRIKPDFVYVDGKFGLPVEIENRAVIKGDVLIPSISAASIIAKTFRDRLMEVFDKRYPLYGFARHKGYPTKLHLENLKRYGPSPIHRLSFSPVARIVFGERRECLIT